MIRPGANNAIRSCPACDSRTALVWGQKNAFQMLCCQECGSIYTTNLPRPASAQDYDCYYTAENLSVPEFIHRRLDEIVANFAAYRQKNRLLEVGFGAGSFLHAAKRAGWEVEGVEVSKSAADHARAEGLTVFCGELGDAHYPNGSFDVVIASELFEHISDPHSLIREIARIIRPGGLCWATTPNARGISSRVLGLQWSVVSPPEHLQLFSERGLRRLMLSAGFRHCTVRTEGVNPFELLQKVRLKEKNNGSHSSEGFNRVHTGLQLNAAMEKSPFRKAAKNLMNELLNLSHVGDSLKIRAER